MGIAKQTSKSYNYIKKWYFLSVYKLTKYTRASTISAERLLQQPPDPKATSRSLTNAVEFGKGNI